MQSEDMKMVKFDILINDLQGFLGKIPINGNFYDEWYANKNDEELREMYGISEKPLHIFDYFIEREEENCWQESIRKNVKYDNCFAQRWSRGKYDSTSDIVQLIYEKSLYNMVDMLDKIRDHSRRIGYKYQPYANCSYYLVFWLILYVSVSNESFNNNLNVVADVAYILEFTEDMLEDWTYAVKCALAGKKFEEISLKTIQAQAFFQNKF